MECPACSASLRALSLGDLEIDVCRDGCAGIWFDNRELDKVDEAHESAGAPLLDFQPVTEPERDKRAKRPCPRDRTVMMRHHFSAHREVEVDTCPRCAGVWLDAGELALLRQQTEEGRRAELAEVFDACFGRDLRAMRAEGEARRAQAESIARALRWICPSYWIPGKQNGAAF